MIRANKAILYLFLILGFSFSLLTIGNPVSGNETVYYEMYVDNNRVIADVPFREYGGEIFVTMRALAEGMELTIIWNAEISEITFEKDETTVIMTLGDSTAIVNGEPVEMVAGPVIVHGRIMVPARFLVETFGYTDRVEFVNVLAHGYQIQLSASPLTGGAVIGGGIYEHGTNIVVTATANSGYRFDGWRENGVIVSTSPSYAFTVNADRTLIANFSVVSPPQEIVIIPDTNLEQSIRYALNKPTGDITKADMESLTRLDAYNKGIASIEGLEYAINLEVLDIGYNQIEDISALSNLSQLYGLAITRNNITDIEPLKFLENLYELYMGGNMVSDLSPLKDLTKLYILTAPTNNINDVSMIGSLSSLRWLLLHNNNISSIEALSNLTDLWGLGIGGNDIEDFSPISSLVNLEDLFLESSNITDISFIEGLTKIKRLGLNQNGISNLTVVGNLTNLEQLDLSNNQINDISALSNLTNLQWLNISNNYLDISAGSDTMLLIQQLIDDGVNVVYEPQSETVLIPSYQIQLLVNPTAGGTVIGGGIYEHGTNIVVTATANSGYRFDGWRENGVIVSTSPSYAFTVNADRTLIANFSVVSPPPAGGGGGGFVPPPPPPEPKEDEEEEEENQGAKTPVGTIDETLITRETFTREDGKTVETHTLKAEAAEQITKAREAGESSIQITVEPTAASVVALFIPGEILESAAGMAVLINTPKTTLELPAEMIQRLASAEEDISLRVESGDTETVKQRMADVPGAAGARVLGAPIIINTAIRGNTIVTLSFTDIDFPADPLEREAFLEALRVFVVHSDGERKVIKGDIIYKDDGRAAGIRFTVDRFSTFALIKLPTEAINIKLTIGKHEAFVDGEIHILEAKPFVFPGVNRTLLPIRFLSEAMAFKVTWIEEKRQAVIKDSKSEIVITIDSEKALVNGQEVNLDCPAKILPPGRTFVPLRFISENMGARVIYNHETREINITK